MKRTIHSLIFVLCIVFSVAGAYNVMADNAEVEKLAKEIACGQDGKVEKTPPSPKDNSRAKPVECRAQKTSMERNPIAQTFEFATTTGRVTVRCSRSLVLFGEYACARR